MDLFSKQVISTMQWPIQQIQILILPEPSGCHSHRSSVPLFKPTVSSPVLCIALCPCHWLSRTAFLKLYTKCSPSPMNYHTESVISSLVSAVVVYSAHSSPAINSLISQSPFIAVQFLCSLSSPLCLPSG